MDWLKSKRVWGLILYGVARSLDAAGYTDVAGILLQVAELVLGVGFFHAVVKERRGPRGIAP